MSKLMIKTVLRLITLEERAAIAHSFTNVRDKYNASDLTSLTQPELVNWVLDALMMSLNEEQSKLDSEPY